MARMHSQPSLRIPEPARWYWIGAIWAGVGLFEATQTVVVMHGEGMHHAWLKLFLYVLMQWLPWALVTPAVMHLGRRYPLLPLRSAMPWLRHLGAWLLLISVTTAWGALLEEWLQPYAPDELPAPLLLLWEKRFVSYLLASLILYYCILVAGYILDSRARAAQLRIDAARLGEQLSKAELSALRHQIEPHFLFNVLNSVTGLIRNGDSEAAVSMIARLSEFMRHLLRDSGRQEMTLDEELTFLNMYLDLQRVRFADRLTVDMNIEAGLGRTLVPSLVLQPIVENAIKHGIAQQIKGGLIDVRVARQHDMLTMEVFNEGPLLPGDWDGRDSAIGLANVRDRLKSLYGDAARLVIANARGAGVLVTISLPVREAPV
jgi:two-component system LytT family sensor kinase